MDKNATPLDLSKMPLTPPSAPEPKPTPPAPPVTPVPPAPPAAPTPAPVTLPPVPPAPQPSHDSHNPGPVAPTLPPLEQKPSRSAAPFIVAVLIVVLAAIGTAAYFMQPKKQIALQPTPVTEVTPTPFFLQIKSPSGETGMVAGEVLVSGQTFPNTAVSVYSDIDDAAIQSDGSGYFETTVIVGEEGGAIKVSAYNVNGEEKSTVIDIARQAVLGKSDAPGQQKKEEASPSAKSTGQPEKQAAAADSPSAASAPKSKQNAKEQTDKTAFLSVKTKEPAAAKLGPEKLKQLLGNPESSESAALGVKSIEAKPASPGATLKRHGIMGVITAVTDTSVTIMHQNQSSQADTIFYNINTVIQSESDKSGTAAALTVGERINAVGFPTDVGLLATRIHIIPGNPVDVSAVFRIAPTGAATGAAGTLPTGAVEASPAPAATASGAAPQ